MQDTNARTETHDLNVWHALLYEKQKAGNLTRNDAQLLCLLDIRNNLITQTKQNEETKEHNDHMEGMAEAQDVYYAQAAEKMGLVYPYNAVNRERLHQYWLDEKALQAGGGDHAQQAEGSGS